jgi:transcriptional regulator with XRE-family HTH domain
MSLRTAARVAGIGRTMLSEIERQDRPDPQPSVLLKLQYAYGLASIEELLGEPPGQPSRDARGDVRHLPDSGRQRHRGMTSGSNAVPRDSVR